MRQRLIYTWISPDNSNQIDSIAVNKQCASSILDAKSRPGADCYTDHVLTSTKLRIKAFRNKRNKLPLRFVVDRLRHGEDLKYAVDTDNRFQVLCDAITEETTPNELWASMEDLYKDNAKYIFTNKLITLQTSQCIGNNYFQSPTECNSAVDKGHIFIVIPPPSYNNPQPFCFEIGLLGAGKGWLWV